MGVASAYHSIGSDLRFKLVLIEYSKNLLLKLIKLKKLYSKFEVCDYPVLSLVCYVKNSSG